MVPLAGLGSSQKHMEEASQLEIEARSAPAFDNDSFAVADVASAPGDAGPSQREEDAAAVADEKVVVKLSTRRQAEPVKMRIGRREPMSKMFAAFEELASRNSWVSPGAQLRFVFDGDALSPEDTADGVDIEDDCVIEAHW